jgi:hypothetical protein
MRNFRLLKADEIECRISQITGDGCALLLYKTARTDYQLLDETVGMYNWQNEYEVIDGKMYCCISIYNPQIGEWIEKWNCGTESNTEAEKGQASDAMKRAGFAWGIGTELYSAPFIWIPLSLLEKVTSNEKGRRVNDRFSVKEIGYDESENISSLVIVNQSNKVVYTFPKSSPIEYPAPAKPVGTISNLCENCGKPVSEKVMNYSKKKFGRCLCMDCQK